MGTHKKGLVGRKAKVGFEYSPTTKAVLKRLLATAEVDGLVEVIRMNDRPAYVVREGRMVKPLEFWQGFRRVALGMTPAPDETRRHAQDVLQTGRAKLLTHADCIFILNEAMANGSR